MRSGKGYDIRSGFYGGDRKLVGFIQHVEIEYNTSTLDL